MSKELLHTLFNRQFYLDNKDLITEELFTGVPKDLFNVITWAYVEQGVTHNITAIELKHLYNAYSPSETLAKKNLVNLLIDDLDGKPLLSEDVAVVILKQAMVIQKQEEAAQELLDKPNANLDKIREILFDIEKLKSNANINADLVDMDIDSLLSRTNKNCRWKFNVPELSDMCGGIGDGVFTLIAGRVNSGKSLASISFCFSPGGFAEQGAKILYLCNEEDGAFTGIRAISSFTGMTLDQIKEDKLGAAKTFSKIRNNVIPIDNARISMSALAKMVDKHRPDIVVADMLDHIQVGGDYAREDLRLGKLYRESREIAKMYRCAFIGVSQTSAESDGKLYYGFDALAGSKTDKPAACDLILLLGQNPPDDNGNYSPQRAINVAKNKITGRHGAINALIVPEISRLVA